MRHSGSMSKLQSVNIELCVRIICGTSLMWNTYARKNIANKKHKLQVAEKHEQGPM